MDQRLIVLDQVDEALRARVAQRVFGHLCGPPGGRQEHVVRPDGERPRAIGGVDQLDVGRWPVELGERLGVRQNGSGIGIHRIGGADQPHRQPARRQPAAEVQRRVGAARHRRHGAAGDQQVERRSRGERRRYREVQRAEPGQHALGRQIAAGRAGIERAGIEGQRPRDGRGRWSGGRRGLPDRLDPAKNSTHGGCSPNGVARSEPPWRAIKRNRGAFQPRRRRGTRRARGAPVSSAAGGVDGMARRRRVWQ